MNYIIDNMNQSDWPQVSAIYLDGINTKLATFQSSVPTWNDWNIGHCEACRFVARSQDIILGWVALTPFSGRCVYAGVAELSIYIGEKYKGMGVGTTLMNHLIQRSEEEGYWTLLSGIIRENTPSRRLHEKCGFREVGYRERVGKMSTGKWHDVIIMERRSKLVGD